jgi:hypothetical protein
MQIPDMDSSSEEAPKEFEPTSEQKKSIVRTVEIRNSIVQRDSQDGTQEHPLTPRKSIFISVYLVDGDFSNGMSGEFSVARCKETWKRRGGIAFWCLLERFCSMPLPLFLFRH